jgi:hypothetical protein
VKREIAPEQAVVIAEPRRETRRLRVEQNQIRVEARRIHENHAREILGRLLRLCIDDAHALRLPRFLVVQH